MCDVAYAAWLERLDGDVRAVASGAAAQGAQGVIEAIEEARSRFDEILCEEPEFTRLDPEQQALRVALGVA